MAKNKGKGKGKDRRQHELEQQAQEIATNAADVAYQPQLDQVQGEIRAARGHRHTIDRAYDAYEKELRGITAAQDQATAAAQGGVAAAAQLIGAATGAQAAQGTQQAAATSEILGQSGLVPSVIQQTAAQAGLSQGQEAIRQVGDMANIGLAGTSDLRRRAATGERDRIRARDDLVDRIFELKHEKRDIKGHMADVTEKAYFDFLQQEEQNQLARAGLRMDSKAAAQQAALDQARLNLDAADQVHDNTLADQAEAADEADMIHDNRHDGSGGSNGGGGGLTGTEAQQYGDYVDKVNAAAARIRQIMQAQGVDAAEARRRAQQQGGFEEWQVRLASALVTQGSLTRAQKQLWRAKVPGDQVPANWR